jgi:hypothetical protein
MGHLGRLGGEGDLGGIDLRAGELLQPAISSSGRSVNMRRKRPTSASAVSRQNCQ